MITNKLQNINNYKGLSKYIDTVIDYIIEYDLNKIDFGKHIINDDIFFIKSKYTTKSKKDSFYEAHLKYIDFQVILEGEELIYGSDVENLTETTKYSSENEAAFYKGKYQWCILGTKNTFAIFNFDDGHMPGVTNKDSSDIVKVVFKINGEK